MLPITIRRLIQLDAFANNTLSSITTSATNRKQSSLPTSPRMSHTRTSASSSKQLPSRVNPKIWKSIDSDNPRRQPNVHLHLDDTKQLQPPPSRNKLTTRNSTKNPATTRTLHEQRRASNKSLSHNSTSIKRINQTRCFEPTPTSST
ncbi:hypothetical protein Droror1_Dr00017647 [Drosera rotundifolia]